MNALIFPASAQIEERLQKTLNTKSTKLTGNKKTTLGDANSRMDIIRTAAFKLRQLRRVNKAQGSLTERVSAGESPPAS